MRLTFAPRVLFLSADPERVRAQLGGRACRSPRPRAAARRRLDRRDHAGADDACTSTPRSGAIPTPASRPAASCRSAATRCATPASRSWWPASATARAPRASTASSPRRAAGMRLVIAESFERIYRQNADNVGLFTSAPTSACSIASSAGRRSSSRSCCRPRRSDRGDRARGRPAALRSAARMASRRGAPPRERRAAAHAVREDRRTAIRSPAPRRTGRGQGGFVRADLRFIHEYYTGMAAHLLDSRARQHAGAARAREHRRLRGPPVVRAPQPGARVAGAGWRRAGPVARAPRLRRHARPQAPRLSAGARGAATRATAAARASRTRWWRSAMRCPASSIVGTDSHTPHSGALGCVAFGVGTTDMANAFVTGAVRFTMPPLLRVECRRRAGARRQRQGPGAAPAGAAGVARGRGRRQRVRVRRPRGARAAHRRARDADQHDGRTRRLHRHRRARRRDRALPARAPRHRLRARALDEERRRRALRAHDRDRLPRRSGRWWRAPATRVKACRWRNWPNARRSTSPTAARAPPASARTSTSTTRCWPGPPRADCARASSCTCSSARSTCATTASGAVTSTPSRPSAPRCCSRRAVPAPTAGRARRSDADQVSVSAINRNFPGRSGPGQVWLASPATVAASAITGRLASFDELRASVRR